LSPMRSITWPTYFASSSGRWTRKTSVCRGRGVPAELAEPGILVVSELVTNGIQHAGTPTIVWAEYEAGTLTVAVTAGEALLPALLAPDDAREGGRGIAKPGRPWSRPRGRRPASRRRKLPVGVRHAAAGRGCAPTQEPGSI
jgi:hypothetical protein